MVFKVTFPHVHLCSKRSTQHLFLCRMPCKFLVPASAHRSFDGRSHFEGKGPSKHSRQEDVVPAKDATAVVSIWQFRSSREVYLKRPVASLDWEELETGKMVASQHILVQASCPQFLRLSDVLNGDIEVSRRR